MNGGERALIAGEVRTSLVFECFADIAECLSAISSDPEVIVRGGLLVTWRIVLDWAVWFTSSDGLVSCAVYGSYRAPPGHTTERFPSQWGGIRGLWVRFP